MKKKENVLVFCSHSDDQIFGPGATIAKYAKEKKGVYTFIFSYGEKGNPLLKPEIVQKIRTKESEKADKLIGGKGVKFFGLTEGKFKEEAEQKKIYDKISKIVKTKKPIKIFTHSIDDPHPDHKAVYNIVMGALEKCKYKGDVLLFDVWNPVNARKTDLPRLYEDVSETFELKVKALKLFQSQKIALWTLLWSVYLRAWLHGQHIHKKYSERFFKIK